MNRFNDLLSYFNEPLNQTQREAVVDLLLWTMYVDKSVHYRESDQIDEIAAELSEDLDLSLLSHIKKALPRIRDMAFNQENWSSYLIEINEDLENESVRRSAYQLCLEVAEADKDMVDAELQFLDIVKESLNV